MEWNVHPILLGSKSELFLYSLALGCEEIVLQPAQKAFGFSFVLPRLLPRASIVGLLQKFCIKPPLESTFYRPIISIKGQMKLWTGFIIVSALSLNSMRNRSLI